MPTSTSSCVSKIRDLMVSHGYDKSHDASHSLARLRREVRDNTSDERRHMSNDVARHYNELKAKLLADGFTPDSKVMRNVDKLKDALSSDGFLLADTDIDTADTAVAFTDAPPTVMVSPVLADSADSVRAFRVLGSFDVLVLQSVFESLPEWKLKVVPSRNSDNTFLVAYNTSSISPDAIREAVRNYLKWEKSYV